MFLIAPTKYIIKNLNHLSMFAYKYEIIFSYLLQSSLLKKIVIFT